MCLWLVVCGVWNHRRARPAQPCEDHTINACTYSRVREGFLQMHDGDGSWAARTRVAELADPNVDPTLLWRHNRPRLFGLARLGPLKPARLRLGCTDSTEPVPCVACQSGIQDTGATHNATATLLHAAAGACFVFVVCCCVGVPVDDVGMYKCGATCHACCGVLQRRHHFDAFLRRSGKRQPQELVRRWLGTATRNNLSDDSSIWTFTCRMTVSITAEFKGAKNEEKWTPTSEGVGGHLPGDLKSAAQHIPLKHRGLKKKFASETRLRFTIPENARHDTSLKAISGFSKFHRLPVKYFTVSLHSQLSCESRFT